MTTSEKRRSPGGLGITKRGEKYEATYNVPKEQLPPGAPRKRITAWGDTEKLAMAALIEKLATTNIAPELPQKLTAAQIKETRTLLGPDGDDVQGVRPAKYQGDLGPLLKDWAAEWERDWIGDVQESTKAIYAGHIKTYILPYLGDYHLNQLDAKTLKTKWWDPIGELKKVKGGIVTDEPLLGNSSRGNVYKTLRIILTTAFHKLGTRIALTEKLIKIPKAKRPETDRQVKEASKHLSDLFIDNPDRENPQWSLFALSLVGLRQAERLGIRVQDVDLSDPDDTYIEIHQQLDFSKARGGWYLKDITKNGEPRAVPIWGVFLEAVKKQLEWRKEWAARPDWNPPKGFEDLLFLQPGGEIWTRRADSPAWHEFVGPGIRGHLARHVTGHILAEQGVSLEAAKVLLGHKSDAYAYYYRVISTKQSRRELTAAGRPVVKQQDVIDLESRRRA